MDLLSGSWDKQLLSTALYESGALLAVASVSIASWMAATSLDLDVPVTPMFIALMGLTLLKSLDAALYPGDVSSSTLAVRLAFCLVLGGITILICGTGILTSGPEDPLYAAKRPWYKTKSSSGPTHHPIIQCFCGIVCILCVTRSIEYGIMLLERSTRSGT